MYNEIPFFTIVIPIYNAEKTILRCLQSIEKQSYQNFEIILVDDKSTDNSLEMIKRERDRDSRINIIINLQNRGPSYSRNIGIKYAKGEYILFVDADDYVSNDYLRTILNSVISCDKPDLLFFSHYEIEKDYVNCVRVPDYQDDYYSNLINLVNGDLFGYTCLKAYKRNAIANIRFDEDIRIFEDELFTCRIINNGATINYVDEPIYYYDKSNNTMSLSNTIPANFPEICDRIFSLWKEITKNFSNELLVIKANRYSWQCEYNFYNKQIQVNKYINSLLRCEFFCYCEKSNNFLNGIRKKKWLYLYSLYKKDKIRQWIQNK